MSELGRDPERDSNLNHLTESAHAEKALKGEDTILNMSEFSLFGVFDGLGGHGRGEVASQAASRAVGRYFKEMTGELNRSNAMNHMKNSFLAAIEAITAEGYAHGNRGMATTATVLHIFEDDGEKYAVYGHVGDTRLYACLNGDKPVQITEDEGEGNILRNSLDALRDESDLKQFSVFQVESGDRFMIFSDGITGDWAGEEVFDYTEMDFINMPDQSIPQDEFTRAARLAAPADSAKEFLRLSRKEDDKSALVVDVR